MNWGQLKQTLKGVKTDGRYPVDLAARHFEAEELPPGGDSATFAQDEATTINRARLEHLASLDLPLAGKSVLEVGCGIGMLSHFFLERGCALTCFDGRSENIKALRERFGDAQNLSARVLDMDNDSLTALGRFDVVFCYGLLYHLENPLRAIRQMAEVCDGMLLLETCVCDSALPVLRLAEETKTFSQALQGVGCRPSPSYVVLGLNRAGFPWVYQPSSVPDYPDFHFGWRNDLSSRRAGNLMRCVFIASKHPMDNPKLHDLLNRERNFEVAGE